MEVMALLEWVHVGNQKIATVGLDDDLVVMKPKLMDKQFLSESGKNQDFSYQDYREAKVDVYGRSQY